MSEKPAIRGKVESQKSAAETQRVVAQLRTLAHDLSNSLEEIIQVS
jgi:SpoVK/Ycf46/Vps4 family AAA+-type ATPase